MPSFWFPNRESCGLIHSILPLDFHPVSSRRSDVPVGWSVGLWVRFVANCIWGEKPFSTMPKKSKSAIRYFYIFSWKSGNLVNCFEVFGRTVLLRDIFFYSPSWKSNGRETGLQETNIWQATTQCFFGTKETRRYIEYIVTIVRVRSLRLGWCLGSKAE
jgi:hypothetical protein